MPPPRRPAPANATGPGLGQSQWQSQSTGQQQQPRPRTRVPSRPTSRNETTPPAATSTAQQPGAAPVRRNLFSSTLSRRPQPTPTSSSSEAPTVPNMPTGSSRVASMPAVASSSNANSASGFTPGPSYSTAAAGSVAAGTVLRGTSHGSGLVRKDEILDEDDDILVPEPADAAGKKAALEKELLIRNLEEANLAAASTGAGGADGDGLDDGPQMDEKEHSARLIELYRSHARQRIDPNELKAAVQESLRRKVASLDDDKWMYEAESDSEES